MTIDERAETAKPAVGELPVLKNRTRVVLIAFAFFCLLVWAFSPVLTSDYGYNDDYEWITRAAQGLQFNQVDALSSGQSIRSIRFTD